MMDIRSIPYPPDLPVISEQGMFTGWTITVELEEEMHSIRILKSDTCCVIGDKLRRLASDIETDRS